jgi:hypothetical protein
MLQSRNNRGEGDTEINSWYNKEHIRTTYPQIVVAHAKEKNKTPEYNYTDEGRPKPHND